MQRLNKVDVVNKQLSKAIRLFFKNDDPIVIHTLVAPAHQILSDLSKHLNTTKSLVRAGGNYAVINFPYNFMKHADKDPDGIIYISDEIGKEFVELFIMDSILLLISIQKNDIPLEIKLFFSWYVSNKKDKFLDIENRSHFKEIQSLNIGNLNFNVICDFLQFYDFSEELTDQS